jgi:DNA polymerase I
LLLFDTESDGFLREATTIHSMVIIDTDTEDTAVYTRGGAFGHRPLEEGLARLEEAKEVAGHNIVGYDLPLIRKIYPKVKITAKPFDTAIAARLNWPNQRELDATKPRLLKKFADKDVKPGSHSLKAWGLRLGEEKQEFDGPWDTLTEVMVLYMIQDGKTNLRLFRHIREHATYPDEALDLEHRVAAIIERQVAYGFAFDSAKADDLLRVLTGHLADLEDKARALFPPWYAPKIEKGTAEKTPARNMRRKEDRDGHLVPTYYSTDAPYSKVKLVVFNPGSRDHIIDRLTKKYGWVPTEHTPAGKAKVDETVLRGLPFDEAALLSEYLTVQKRMSQLATGDDAIMNHVASDGAVHGEINTLGTVTTRMSHFKPNVAQTPSIKNRKGDVLYGREFRELYKARPGKKLVGCDADGLEARFLAHYMGFYDDGAYATALLAGKKEEGTDVHSVTRDALALNTRDAAKTYLYALIYGAGAWKLGMTVYLDMTPEQMAKVAGGKNKDKALTDIGNKSKDRIMRNLPALGKLTTMVANRADKQGWIKGLDGRRLPVRKAHASLNTLLQSAGAIVMKRALVIFDDDLQAAGLVPGVDYEFVANVHDEFQVETTEAHAKFVGTTAAEAIRKAGEFYSLRLPLAGNFSIGDTWAATH